jgi:NTP pyrophosphatase (non-canonical NTP hydrolase)
MTSKQTAFDELLKRIADFGRDRDWGQYHNPKNLSMALAVEAAELMEIFQWLTPEQSQRENLTPKQLQAVTEEVADVVIYAIQIAQQTDIDLLDAISKKIDKNERKYPVDKIKGKASLE